MIEEIKAKGYRVFLAERGDYGFYTDVKGSRVVSFETKHGHIFGNYRTSIPQQTGTGWRISERFNADDIDTYFKARAPRWAVQSVAWKYTTLEQHLATNQKSSRYTEQ